MIRERNMGGNGKVLSPGSESTQLFWSLRPPFFALPTSTGTCQRGLGGVWGLTWNGCSNCCDAGSSLYSFLFYIYSLQDT